MSSFDSLAGGEAGDLGEEFSPLCPAVPETRRAVWQPLGADPTAEPKTLEPEVAREPPPPEPSSPEAAAEPEQVVETSPAFSAGYEAGREETRAEVEAAAEALVGSLREVGALRVRLREHAERQALELALAVARKILRAEVTERKELWIGMIREAIQRAADRDEVRVRVPRGLSGYLREQLPQLRAQLDDVKELVIVEDAALEEGGCVIETRLADLDLGIEQQVDQVRRELGRIG